MSKAAKYWPAFVLLAICVTTATAAPKPDLWPHWTAHDTDNLENIDHSAWQRFLGAYVAPRSDGLNVVDYGRVSRTDRAGLDAYVEALAATPITQFNRREQLAYWINLYNALTVKVVLDHYFVDSIRDIKLSGFFKVGPWDKELLTIEGKPITLNDIEHRILRPIWKDPRIHYAVNCASVGCPNLQTQVFTAANAEQLLDKGAKEYINSSRGVEIRGKKVRVSSIYDWFREDFGASDQDVLNHLQQYAEPPLKTALAGASRVSGDYYDWSLNDAAGPARAASRPKRRGS